MLVRVGAAAPPRVFPGPAGLISGSQVTDASGTHSRAPTSPRLPRRARGATAWAPSAAWHELLARDTPDALPNAVKPQRTPPYVTIQQIVTTLYLQPAQCKRAWLRVQVAACLASEGASDGFVRLADPSGHSLEASVSRAALDLWPALAQPGSALCVNKVALISLSHYRHVLAVTVDVLSDVVPAHAPASSLPAGAAASPPRAIAVGAGRAQIDGDAFVAGGVVPSPAALARARLRLARDEALAAAVVAEARAAIGAARPLRDSGDGGGGGGGGCAPSAGRSAAEDAPAAAALTPARSPLRPYQPVERALPTKRARDGDVCDLLCAARPADARSAPPHSADELAAAAGAGWSPRARSPGDLARLLSQHGHAPRALGVTRPPLSPALAPPPPPRPPRPLPPPPADRGVGGGGWTGAGAGVADGRESAVRAHFVAVDSAASLLLSPWADDEALPRAALPERAAPPRALLAAQPSRRDPWDTSPARLEAHGCRDGGSAAPVWPAAAPFPAPPPAPARVLSASALPCAAECAIGGDDEIFG